MSNSLYDKGRESFLSQNPAIDWDTDIIKCALVLTAYAVNLATDQYLNPAFNTNIATNGRSAAFTAKTVTAGVADAADVTLTAVSGTQVSYIVIYKDTGTDTTSPLIAYIDTATGLPFTPNGGDVTIAWDNAANRIFKL